MAQPSLDGPLAKQFCTSPGFKDLKCGLASEAEQAATLKHQCPACGVIFRKLPTALPAEVSGVDQYDHGQFAVAPISLACQGPVVVRSVFKMLDEPPLDKQAGWAADCINSAWRPNALMHVDEAPDIGRNATYMVRCDLELPSSGGSEAERAMRGKEVKCWTCNRCLQGTNTACPSAKGRWYSDSYTTVARGCDFVESNGYVMHRVGFHINPRTKIQLAKFEVCNSAGCFDAAYEQQKLDAAKACVNASC
jgi:hypothetical protein